MPRGSRSGLLELHRTLRSPMEPYAATVATFWNPPEPYRALRNPYAASWNPMDPYAALGNPTQPRSLMEPHEIPLETFWNPAEPHGAS